MNSEVMQTPQLSNGRLLLLGVSSVILSLSFFMSVFAPFPLALSVIMYGRLKGYAVGLMGLIPCFLFAQYYGSYAPIGFYLCVLFFGFGVAEIVKRNFAPVKSIVVYGLSFFLLAGGAFFKVLDTLNQTPKEFIMSELNKNSADIEKNKKMIENNGDKDSIELLNLLNRPDLIADNAIENFPSVFFIGINLMLWFNMFLVLKSRRLLFSGNDYPYSEKDLINFKVPFGFVVVLCIGFVMAVWGKDFGSAAYELWGFTIIKCLGIFYFFQGFGVFSDLLNFLGVMGFFRTLIVIITIFTGNYLIAAAGLFDNWFDFRKYFVKQKTED